jgi:REP element-mobilizing transposase RayT
MAICCHGEKTTGSLSGGTLSCDCTRQQRAKVFRREADFELYLKLLKDYKQELGFLLYAYALMPTHVHLLLESGDTPVSGLMQRLQFRYTRNYNIRYKTWGHLFQGRHKAILCEKDSDLVELSVYLHLNPVRAGIVQNPKEYLWTRSCLAVPRDSKRRNV